jgi:hypothetical protein
MTDEINYATQCFNCKHCLTVKPWISVQCEENIIHGCSYKCGTQLKDHIGKGYWDDVINKEDFNEPRPNIYYKSPKELELIKIELDEEQRMNEEMDHDNESDDYDYDHDLDSSDEEYYE